MQICPVCSRAFEESRESCVHVLDGKYRIESVLGSGGMATVYRATQLRLERPVAIKLVRGDFEAHATQVERFKREALTVGRLKHANIVTVHDFGVDDELGVYIVMEHLEGATLRDELKQRKRLDASEAMAVAQSVCEALEVAHGAGVVHRDIKPENIFLETTRGGRVAKVLDFGVAKLRELPPSEEGALTIDGAVVGTPMYMSPEQCQAQDLDGRSDVYSLGCVLYELISGRPPFRGSTTLAVMNQHVTAMPEPLSEAVADVPATLAAAVARSLAKKPRDRFQTAADFARALVAEHTSPRTVALDQETVEMGIGDTAVTMAPTLTDRRAAPNNLPTAVSNFVGRRREVVEAAVLLRTERVVTMTGPGGIGKTRLALAVASDLLDTFVDGVWLVELASLTDPALVTQTVATELGVREEPGVALDATVAGAIGTGRVLLVLDNCEHLVAACAGLVSSLLRACPGLGVLATSREALSVAGETVYRVQPLGVGSETADAVRLLMDRIRARNAQIAVTEANLALAATICERLDGIPLAIELAAARARVLTLDQILARLGDRFKLLAGGDRDATARQRTMRAAIDWSYELLDDDERALLRRLSVFSGGCTIDAAEAICSSESLEHSALSTQHAALGTLQFDVLDALAHLADKSLVTVDATGDEARYGMLETIREYARERLAEAGEAEALRARHAAWYLELVERAEAARATEDAAVWLARLETEHDNLRAALRRTAEAGDVEARVRLCAALGWFWNIRGHWTEGRSRFTETLAAAGDAFPALRGKILNLAGALAGNQDDFDGAKRLYEESLAVRRGIGDRPGVAKALHNLGVLMREQGDLDHAAPYYEESFAIFREVGRPHDIAISLNSFGSLLLDRGDLDRAEEAIAESLEICRSIGDLSAGGAALHNLGELARRRGDPEQAEVHFSESVAVARDLGYPELEAASTCELGWVALTVGDLDGARERFAGALETQRVLGDRGGVLHALEGLACVAAGRGEPDRALRIAGAIAASRHELGTVSLRSHSALVDRWLGPARAEPGAAAELEAGRRRGIELAIAEALR